MWMWWWFQFFSSCLVLLILVQLVRVALSDCDLLLSLYARGKGRNLAALRGKVVWITGASSGIGEELAYSLAGLGSKLILSARREVELQRVLDNCKTFSPPEYKNDHMILCLDLNDCDSHAALTEQVIQQYGKVDYLVNNAGRSQRAVVTQTSLEVDRAIIELNTIGTISLTKTLLPHMIQQRSGAIVVMSSIAGKLGSPGSASYSASKHALQGYFNALRMEIADKGVKVLMVCPGPVVSKISQFAFTTSLDKQPTNNDSGLYITKMPTVRCAYLTAVTMANNLSEVWISPHPVLLYMYAFQYLPSIAAWLGGKLGPSRAKIVEKGGMQQRDSTKKKD